ncbi:helix-turn-helix transcriptional regulator [Microbispora triticiradicis]|uniref:helix-turn-helix transcriptional regulator n=1 Tax=Microbispora triticiradicis TaxID=2200763 RepID=UPI001AD79294|nr:helix-turn-helix transcriptional regulator [Microbispora triticiradicis]MBO4275309.1 helix-turn-helix domain-containing protein [Microbispora triticiradicis]
MAASARRTAAPGRQPGERAEARYVRRRPAPPLRPLVAWYSGYRDAGIPPGTHRGLPSPYLTMIVTLDDPLVVAAHPDPRTPPRSYDTLLGGLHTAPAIVTHDGRQSGVQLALTPLGARALLGLPAGELSGLDLDGADVLGALAGELRERLLEASGWDGRFTALDAVLSRHTRPTRERPSEVSRAWRRMLAAGGRVTVSGLAREAGWSTRHLNGRFREEIGLSPKEAARVVRFDRVRRLLQSAAASGPRLALADAAAECGFYDQAHLAREFRSLAGCSPSRWLAEERVPFRNVQALTGDRRPDSAA